MFSFLSRGLSSCGRPSGDLKAKSSTKLPILQRGTVVFARGRNGSISLRPTFNCFQDHPTRASQARYRGKDDEDPTMPDIDQPQADLITAVQDGNIELIRTRLQALVEANGGPPPKDATRKPRSVSFGTGQDAVMDSLEDALLVAADDAPAEVVHALLGPFRGSEWLKTLLARPLVASIHGAAEQGKGRALARVQALIEHGADVNRDDGDDTPLQKAAYCGRSDLVRPLIAAGADPDLGRSIEDGRRWMTPLVYAVMCDDVASAKALLEAGASTDAWAATEGGFQSALSLASGRFTFHGAGKGLSTHAGNPDMVRLLLDFGAPIQPDRPPLMAISPVKAATISRSKDVLDLLLESHPPHEVIQEALFNSRGIHVDQEVRDKLMAAGGRLAA